jgi:hypothetical protein
MNKESQNELDYVSQLPQTFKLFERLWRVNFEEDIRHNIPEGNCMHAMNYVSFIFNGYQL